MLVPMRPNGPPYRHPRTARRAGPARVALPALLLLLALSACSSGVDTGNPSPAHRTESAPVATAARDDGARQASAPTPASTVPAAADRDPAGVAADPVATPELDDLDDLLADLDTVLADLDAGLTQQEGDIFDE
jgi:hypothetical protein